MNYHDALRASWLSQLNALTRVEFFIYSKKFALKIFAPLRGASHSLRVARFARSAGETLSIVGTIPVLEFASSYLY